MSTLKGLRAGGPIAWMATNPVAANLLMAVILIGGLIGMLRMKQEVFPEFDLDLVVVSVPYPGASPSEVEQGIVLVTEEAVRGIEGVQRVTSTAREGVGSVNVELLLSADPDKVLNDVKAEVDRITSYPDEAERPSVTLASRRREVISLILAGDQDLKTLHKLAERTRARLLEHENITQVELAGVPPTEVSIELSSAKLEKFGITPEQVGLFVSQASVELPGGELETTGGKILVRVADRRLVSEDFGDIILRSTAGGAVVRLGDVAEIRDGYEDNDQASLYNGQRAVRVTAYRVGAETPTQVAAAVREHAQTVARELPSTVAVEIWADDSVALRDRIDLLVSNAVMGLILVLIILAMFLEIRLAGWVALGIPISFLGAFLLLPIADVSINMVSLFGFIVTIGMVVDDAIIVGEHSFFKMQTGMAPQKAAIAGAREMLVPVTFAILTTLAAFSPLLFVPGVMGKIFKLFPIVVGAVLVWSLIESFFILPAHIAHMAANPRSRLLKKFEGLHHFFGGKLDAFTERVYQPAVRFAVRWRYATIAMAMALLLVSAGLIAGRLVPFSFFPELESDQVTASLRLPYGSPASTAARAREVLEKSAEAAIKEHGKETFRGMFTRLGEAITTGPVGRGETGSHLVTIEVSLVPSGEREFTASAFADTWRKMTPPIAGLESLVFNSSTGPGAGAAVEVQLSHPSTDVLGQASEALAEDLRSFSQLASVANDYSSGKPQLDFRLLPAAHTLGLTSADLARQLRGSFFGAEALREQRGRDEMKVMVRLAEDERRSEEGLEQLRIRTPDGGHVPLSYVASFERGRAPTSILREDGRRIVNVSAKLAFGVSSNQAVLDTLKEEVLPSLKQRFPGLRADFVGQQRNQQEAFASLGQNFLVALFVIFALLAIPFKSYAQPLIVMSAIPFGTVGAVFGHLLLGYELSLISMFGIIALAGVVVNDALVLIDATNHFRALGMSAEESIIGGGMRRLRPILLTSLTTFFGLLPMIFETSIQARFLIPMAISLGFGVLFGSVVALFVVPSLYLVLEDLRGFFGFEDPRAPAQDHKEEQRA
jgi:multidrug efflux pump subunit AcrB